MQNTQGRAVVVGASVAGLFAGRALADFFDEVVLLDKESLTNGPTPRKAVPQGNHVHAILSPTYRALQRFLPEVVDDLLANGAEIFDGGSDIKFLIHGEALTAGDTQQPVIGCTRPFFEHYLRQRVLETRNVTIRPDQRFVRWVTPDDGSRVTGVVVGGLDEEEMTADLFIDARGRGSTICRDLQQLGFDAPEEEIVGVDLGYTSRLYRAPGFAPNWNLLLLNAYPPDVSIGGVVERVEKDQWVVTQFGYFGDHAPADDDGFLEFSRRQYAPDITEFLDVAEPVSEFHRFRTKDCRMVRLEKLTAFPERLLAIGDTVCSLNPVYGQGMTKAANEAMHISHVLSEHLDGNQSLDGLADTVRKSLPNVGAEWAWQLTTGADLGFSKTTGQRPPGGALMGWYMKKLFLRATQNLDTRRRIFDATMLNKPPQSLMVPRMLLHALGF